MSWRKLQDLPWASPLDVAARFAGRDIALLYSGLREKFSGRFSYLLTDPLEEISGDNWGQLPTLPASGEALPLWIGYLGYGMREEQKRAVPSPISLPDFRLVRYATLHRFDHESETVEIFTQSDALEQSTENPSKNIPISVAALHSTLTKTQYQSIVADTIEQIRAGNFYQANITRKFYGEFAETPDSWQLFAKLAEASPAPYSAYIAHGGTAILSSSPECFLSIDASGTMTTRPIKGSARRSEDETTDANICAQLQSSAKNHAENLMIVDLMRNDLSRVSEPGSVEVMEQSALYSYRTIHHLISTIRAQKRRGISAYDAVRACFPAGSMTGAPKRAAIDWCSTVEPMERGVYSGAIGWFGAGETCDLSVTIRTLILDGNRFEFQVGGGIVADSTPEEEWRETIAKARGILAALGLSESDLEKL